MFLISRSKKIRHAYICGVGQNTLGCAGVPVTTKYKPSRNDYGKRNIWRIHPQKVSCALLVMAMSFVLMFALPQLGNHNHNFNPNLTSLQGSTLCILSEVCQII